MRSRVARLLPILAFVAVAAPAAIAAKDPGAAPRDARLRGIPVAEYAARRAAAVSALRDGVLVVRGAVEEEFGDDGKFHQNTWFMYLTGCEIPGAYLVLNPFADGGGREVLYVPARDPYQERWTGPKIGPGNDAERMYGFREVRDASNLGRDLRSAFERASKADRRLSIFTIVPAGPDGRYTRDGGFADFLKQLVPAASAGGWTVTDAATALAELRRVKTTAEVAQLSRAIAITNEAQRDVARTLAPGKFEYEVEAAIVSAFLRNGSPRAGFPSIVGSGVYSTVLHYADNTKQIESGDLVVVDIGAEFNYYTADITRTWPANGRFTPRQREIYQLVLDAQESAARAYAPGMTLRNLHAVAVETMRRSPLRDSRGNTLDSAFIHGLSHFLGMEVHDVGEIATPLKVGDVFTIEPGIYLADEKLGVRIEDDYLVTENGLVKLSKDLPSTPDEIERLMGGR